jgi:hypothetical protein
MTVAEMIQKLQQFPKDQEVQITDGFQCKFHFFEFQLSEDTDGSTFVDIGIGGYDYD